MHHFYRFAWLLLALGSAAHAEDQDYAHRVCSLEHPQLENATYTLQGGGTGCGWEIKGGGNLTLTVSDSELESRVEQSRKMLDQLQAGYLKNPEITVKRKALGVCAEDEYLEVSALGQASGFVWARCDGHLLLSMFEGTQGLALAKTMTAAARDAKW